MPTPLLLSLGLAALVRLSAPWPAPAAGPVDLAFEPYDGSLNAR